MQTKILDCTLRDGGYYTDWNFPSQLVESYLNVISKLPIDVIEIGYVSNVRNDKFGLYYHLNKDFLKKVKKIIRKNQKLCCMVNAKEIKNSKDLINLLTKFDGVLDQVRFAVDPKKINPLLTIISETKKKIKKINFSINIMYLSTWYKDLDYANKLISKAKNIVNEIALVDSYGSLKPIEVYFFFKEIIRVNPDVKIGSHFHNNCGLALANTLSAIKAGCNISDSTFKGMGRGAGNAETELLLSLLKPSKINLSNFELDEILEEFQTLKNKLNWGSSFSYSLSAIKGYSQSEMMDLLQTKRLDTSVALTTISSKLKKKEKIKFHNLKIIRNIKSNTPIIIGGAPSFSQYGKNFLSGLKKNVLIILSGSNAFKNFIKLNSKFENKIALILSGSEIKKIKQIRNKLFMKKYNIDFIIIEKDFYTKELKKDTKKIIISESIAINPLLLAGQMLISLGIKNLNLAFFDGDDNSEKGKAIMKETVKSFDYLKKKINIKTFTKSFIPARQINLWNNDKFLRTN